jgi:hypothetical protein
MATHGVINNGTFEQVDGQWAGCGTASVDPGDAEVVRKGAHGRWLMDERRYTAEEDRVHCVHSFAAFIRAEGQS